MELRDIEGEPVDGYSIIGVVLLFTTLLLLSYILLHSHRIKVDLEDQELKRAATIVRLRNTALILGLLAISSFFILLSSMSPLSTGTTEYATRDTLNTYVLYAGLVLFAIAAGLGIVSKKAEFNFRRLLQQYAVREKLAATVKFRRKPKPKPNRTNRA
jgi:Ni/Fe-hydrogenase subunit HybB-like protein